MFIYGIPCGIVRYLTHVKVKRTAARFEISKFLSSVVCNEGFQFLYFTSGFYLPVALVLKQALLEALVEVVDIVVDVGVVVVEVDF